MQTESLKGTFSLKTLEVAGAITPVPGGIGPMTIATLLSNTIDAYLSHAGLAQ